MIRVLALAFFIALSEAAPKKKLSSRFELQKSKVESLRQKVMEIESSLAKRNQQYIEGVKQSQVLSATIQSVGEQLADLENKLALESRKISMLLKNYMMRSLDHKASLSSSDLYLERLMTRGLLEKRKRYKKLQQEVLALQSEARVLQERARDYRENEEALRSLIANLESEKGAVAREFVDSKTVFRQIEGRLAKSQAAQLITKESGEAETALLKMKSPLQSFFSLEKDKDRKGVVYQFDQRSPFYSSYQGSVQYLGRLANYGNLIIINHGNNIRSVLLGDIDPKVKKGQWVTRGELIGHTRPQGKLYFEVRVKNRARNTLSWIDHHSLKTKQVKI